MKRWQFTFTDDDLRRIEHARWNGYRGGLLPNDFPDDARLVSHYREPSADGRLVYRVVYEVPDGWSPAGAEQS